MFTSSIKRITSRAALALVAGAMLLTIAAATSAGGFPFLNSVDQLFGIERSESVNASATTSPTPVPNRMVVVLPPAGSESPATLATITTDQPDYAPGETVIITGTGWQPGETVRLTIVRDRVPVGDGETETIILYATADAGGNVINTEYVVFEEDLGATFDLTALGLTSGQIAHVTFTDALNWSVVRSPTTVSFGVPTTFTFTGTNNGTNCGAESLESFRVTFPNDTVLTSPTATVPTGSWTPGVVNSGTTNPQVTAGVTGDKVCHTQSFTVTVVANIPGPAGSFTFVPEAFHGASFTSPFSSPAGGPFTLSIVANTPPVASSVAINDTTPTYGQLLTGSYTYSDGEGDPQGTSTFRWLRNGTPIGGATALTYTVESADVGQPLRFEVTPVATSGVSPGTAVASAASSAVAKATLTVTASSHTVTFGDAAPPITPGYGTFVSGDTSAVLDTPPTCTTAYTAGSSVSGSPYLTSCSGGADNAYDFSYFTGTVTVNQATPTASVSPTSVPYNGTPQGTTATCLGGGTASNLRYSGSTTVPTNAATYTMLVDCAASTNYAATNNVAAGTFTITQIAPTASVSPTSLPYNGGPQGTTASCLGGGTASNLRYNGSITVPTDAAAYTMLVDCAASTNYTSANDVPAGTFTITQLAPTASVSPTSVAYNGTPQGTTASCLGGGTASNLRYNGSTTVPTNAAVYTMLVDCAASTNYAAANDVAAGTFTITQIAPTATITNTPVVYNGALQTATVACLGGGAAALASGGTGSNAGSYPATVDCAASTNYTAATGLVPLNDPFVISPATPTATITNTPVVYNGASQTATVACLGGGAATLANGGTGTNAGSYPATVDCAASANYTAATGLVPLNNPFVISPATPTATITNTPVVYNGAPQTATVACLGGGAATLASGGTGTNAGSYPATVDCAASANYTAATGLVPLNDPFVISPATPTATITNTPAVYNGTPQTATVACLGGGAATLASGGTGTNAGSYPATVDCAASANYTSATGLVPLNNPFVISPATPTATITNTPVVYNGTPQTATVACLGGGAATLASGGTGTNAGSYPATVDCAASANYTAASGLVPLNNPFVISPATPTATITNTPVVYNGAVQTATVACLGGGAATLASGGTGTNAGSYPATVNCAASANYTAASGLVPLNNPFVISPATPTATITNTPVVYNGTPQTATVACIGGGAATLASGGTGTNAASYPATVDCAASANYTAAAGLVPLNNPFVISPATPTASITNTPVTYNGTPQTATVACLGGGAATLASGGTGTNAGSYPATVNCAASANYTAATSLVPLNNPFVINQATPTASVSPTSVPYNGAPQSTVPTCVGGGAASNLRYNGSTTVPTNAAAYTMLVDCAASANYTAAANVAAGTFTITQIAPTVSRSPASLVYNGSPQGTTVTCLGGGAVSNVRYNGSTTVPTNVATYAILADCAASTNYTAATNLSAGNFDITPAATTTTIISDLPDASVVGQNVTVVYTVTGAGSVTGNVTVTDSASAATCTGTVGAGQCVIVFPTVGARTITATYSPDTNHTGSSDTESHTVNFNADLSIVKTDGVTTAYAGGQVIYTITVGNLGPDAVTGATVNDTFPSAITTAAWTCVGAGGGTCTAGGSGNISDTVNLPNGATVTYTVTADISLAATGTLVNTATVTPPSNVNDGAPGNNTSTDTDTIAQEADLVITKSDGVINYTPGGTTTYTIVAANLGPSNASGATVTDTFPAAITSATWTCVGAGGGVCPAAGAGNINSAVTLPAGSSVTFTVTANISGAASGPLSNTATVTPTGMVPDPDLSNNSATDTDTIAPPNVCSATTTTFTQGTPTAIPTGPAVVTTTLVVSGAGIYLTDVNALTNITHTFAADLDITLTSPAGTVVTLTTDNGAGNDNVFNGTRWDDSSNLAGQVPYTTNPGLATDHPYVNLALASPLTPEEAMGAFIGENPNGTWTITVSDDLAGDGGSINWGLQVTTLPIAPVQTVVPTFTQNTPTAIPTGPAVVTSTLVVSGAPTTGISDLNLTTALTHTFAADLDITLTSPSGTVVTLTSDNGAGNDNVFNGTVWDDDANPAGQVPYTTNNGLVTDHAYVNLTPVASLVPEDAMAAFIGENPNGTWTITISDDLAGDGGTLSSWSLNITTSQCVFNTTTSITSSANPSVFGQPVTFTATVATNPTGGPTPTGAVSFFDNLNPIAGCQNVALNGSGVATCTPATLSVGSHPITATYTSNSGLFINSSGTLTGNPQVVGKANTSTTVTAVPPSPSVFGQSVTFTATVAVLAPGAGTPTGTVSFNIDGNIYCANTPLSAGLTATCTQAGLPALPAGVRNVVAIYSGNANFNGSTGTLNYTVTKANTTTAITSDLPDPSLVNQPYTVSWTVAPAPVQVNSGTPTGTVTVNGGTGGGSCTAAVAAGGCQLTPTTIGVKSVTATYNGDANFNASPASPAVTHTVNVGISGTVRNGLTLAPIAGVSVTLFQLPAGTAITSATTNAAGVYTIAGQFTAPVAVRPTVVNVPYYDPALRPIASLADNVTGIDFLQYPTVGDIPRNLRFVTKYVTPGNAGSMPVILNSQDNEVSVAFSITYDANLFAQPPTFVCGAQAPGCTITQNTSVFGSVGVTIVPTGGAFARVGEAGGESPTAPGLKEIARMNFQTAITANVPSTPIGVTGNPTGAAILDAGANPLLWSFTPGNVVFQLGNEGDVAGRNGGSGTYEAGDVVQTRRFVAGLEGAFVNTFNEYQRADTAPASTKGNGTFDATDVIQTRRYVAGLDAGQSAGGPGFPNPPSPPIAPPARSVEQSEIGIGDATATNSTRISVPVGMKATGREAAVSFTVRYNEARLADPEVTLAGTAPEGATLTVGKAEPGVIRILIDSANAFRAKEIMALVDITFEVRVEAPTGDTFVEVEDLVFSDMEARATNSKATSGTISIAGPNPAETDMPSRVRDREKRTSPRALRPGEDLIEEWLNGSVVGLKRPIN